MAVGIVYFCFTGPSVVANSRFEIMLPVKLPTIF